MFNLIPDILRENIKSDYKLRKYIVMLVFVVFLEVCFLVFLFPTWLVSSHKDKQLTLIAEDASNSLSSGNVNSTTAEIKALNTKLAVLQSALDYPKIIPFLDEILKDKTASISINKIVYTTDDSKNAIISLGGVSRTRDSLLAFVKILESSKLFKKVDLPISNFTKDRDLDFTLSITLEPQT